MARARSRGVDCEPVSEQGELGIAMNIIVIPLHMGDFLTGTMDMDATEVGAYMMLLIAHYQHGEEGLPTDDKSLARIAKVSKKVWDRIKPKMLLKFHFETNPATGRTFLVNERTVEELKKMSRKSAQNSANALKRKRRG